MTTKKGTTMKENKSETATGRPYIEEREDQELARAILGSMREFLPETQEAKAYVQLQGTYEVKYFATKSEIHGYPIFYYNCYLDEFNAKENETKAKNELKEALLTLVGGNETIDVLRTQVNAKWVFDYGYKDFIPLERQDKLIRDTLSETGSHQASLKKLARSNLKEMLD